MSGLLKKHARSLSERYYPDVLVLGLEDADVLLKYIAYSEKVVGVPSIVSAAMKKPEAKLKDGGLDPKYIRNLDFDLRELIDDHFPNIFTDFALDKETRWLRRRKTAGNMKFGDGGNFIGVEPEWHAKVRRRNAKLAKKRRAEQNQRQANCDGKISKRKTQKRSRKNPRRLALTLKVKIPSTSTKTESPC